MLQFFDHINLLVIPTDACNMNCTYCFHNVHTNNFKKMNLATVKRLLDITTPFYKKINIIWHGGEPLLMGLDFYKEVLLLEKNYNCNISNSIQSNLTMLTAEFADFIVENNISISGSFDGIVNEETRGNSHKILEGRELIVSRGKKCGLIMVVSNINVGKLIESYNFFKDKGVNFSLNLYVEQKGKIDSSLELNPKMTAEKLCELFDYWASDTMGTIHISYFKNILEYILFKKKSLCSYTSCMGRWLCVRYDGKITPCNRYFPDKYCYGNVYDYQNIGEAFLSDGFANLLTDAISRRDKCKGCEVYSFCSGGCNNVALNENGVDNNGGINCKILCEVYRHIESYIEELLHKEDDKPINPLLKDMIINGK